MKCSTELSLERTRMRMKGSTELSLGPFVLGENSDEMECSTELSLGHLSLGRTRMTAFLKVLLSAVLFIASAYNSHQSFVQSVISFLGTLLQPLLLSHRYSSPSLLFSSQPFPGAVCS
jgi:hypothetical protein